MKRVVLFLFLTGCMVGPHYQRPEMSLSEKFSEAKGCEESEDQDLCQWWKQFEDPLLDALIQEASTSNFNLRIALEQIIQAREQYKIQRSYLWPEFDLNARATRSRFSQNIFTSASNATSFASGGTSPTGTTGVSTFGPPVQSFFQLGFDTIWELDIWGKFRRSKNAAHDLWEASKDTAQNVLITVVSEVARDYVGIRSLQQQIELTKKLIAADEEQLRLARVLFDAGLDNQIQVESFVSTLESDVATLPILETSLKQAIYTLAVLLGRQPEEFAQTFEEVKPIPIGLGKVPAGVPSDLLRRRPDIRAAERQLAAATEQIGYAVADLFPHIALTGDSYGYEANQVRKWFNFKSSYWTIGPTINWDLIDFGRVRGQIGVAKSLQRQNLLQYEQTVITALQDVEGALVAYFEEQKRNLDLTNQVASNKRSLELTEDLFQAGLADGIQVIAALRTVLTNELTLIQSDQSVTSDLVAVYKALGGDWECSYMR